MDTTLPPKSRAHWSDPILIAVVAVALYVLCTPLPLTNTQLCLILCGAITALLCVIEFIRAPWHATPRPNIALRDVLCRAGMEWLGTMLGLALVLFGWWLLPVYKGPNYKPLLGAMPYVLPLVPVVTAICIFYTEWRLGPAEDYGWHFGLLALGRWRQVNWLLIRDGLFAWFIKGFFLPLNFCWMVRLTGEFRGSEALALQPPWPKAIDSIDTMILVALVVGIVPGYLFSARLFGSEIKKVEHSWFGWAVTLSCYDPVFTGIFRGWLNYHGHAPNPVWMKPWAVAFGDTPELLYAAGGLILFFELIHYWAEAIFGIRASNLSDRGIITNGPYRLCKHPVYGIKCVAWALIWMPYAMAGSFGACVRHTVLFFGICGIFVMRAWVEERLLSTDPVYVAYATWIDEHGMFARLGKAMPVLSYQWRLARWDKARKIV